MKNGLFIETHSLKEIGLKDKGPIYFVKIEKDIKEDNLEEEFEVTSFDFEEKEKEYSFYVKCFNCNEEHFLFIHESFFQRELMDLKFLLNDSHKYKTNENLVKSITKTNDEVVLEKKTDFETITKLKKLNIACPCCKEDNYNFAGTKSINLFLNENNKYFEIKSYGISYLSKDIKRNKFSSMYANKGYLNDLKTVAVKHSVHFIFDKKTNEIYLRQSNGGKYSLISGNNSFYHEFLYMNIEKEDLFISFFKEILFFYHNKFNKYQSVKLDFKEEIKNTSDIRKLMDIFRKIKYHLTFPFAFEVFGEEIYDFIEFESKYYKNKVKKAISGDEILNMYFNEKGLTKKIRNKIKSNPSYFASNEKNKPYEYAFVEFLVRVHDNKGLNELVLNKLLDTYEYVNFSRTTTIRDKNFKYVDYKKLYNNLKKYISIDNVLKMYLVSKNPYNYNTYIKDTYNLIILMDNLLNKKDENIGVRQKNAIIETKKIINKIKKEKNFSLEKLHDKLSFLYNEVNTVFEEYDYTEEELSLNYEKDSFSINLYENSIRLKQSASKLKICAYSYSNRIKSKDSILFELKENDKEKMCIEVKNNNIVQAKLNSNNVIDGNTSKELINALKSWITVKDLKIMTNDLSYIM